VSQIEDDKDGGSQDTIVSPETTLENIPSKYAAKVETAVDTLLSCLANTDGWELLYEKKGLLAYKRSGSGTGSAVCVRGDLTMPFDIMAIFALIYDLSKAKLRDPQLNIHEIKKNYSIHSSVQYLRYKQVFHSFFFFYFLFF
jgi:hypothetical protein